MTALVLRVGCIAVVGSLCALTLRKTVPELALVLALVTAGALLVLMLSAMASVQEGFLALADQAQLDESLTQPVWKVMVISILTRLMSQICRDAGEGTIAVCCELAGTFGALAVTLPLLRQVVGLISELLV